MPPCRPLILAALVGLVAPASSSPLPIIVGPVPPEVIGAALRDAQNDLRYGRMRLFFTRPELEDPIVARVAALLVDRLDLDVEILHDVDPDDIRVTASISTYNQEMYRSISLILGADYRSNLRVEARRQVAIELRLAGETDAEKAGIDWAEAALSRQMPYRIRAGRSWQTVSEQDLVFEELLRDELDVPTVVFEVPSTAILQFAASHNAVIEAYLQEKHEQVLTTLRSRAADLRANVEEPDPSR